MHRDYFGRAAAIFSLENEALLPFLESLLPWPAGPGSAVPGRGTLQNPLPVGKEKGYFDPWRWMCFTPTRCATLRPAAEETKVLEAAQARPGSQSWPRARGEAPTAP